MSHYLVDFWELQTYKLKQFHWHIDHNLIERIRVGMNVLRNAQLDCLFSITKRFQRCVKILSYVLKVIEPEHNGLDVLSCTARARLDLSLQETFIYIKKVGAY